MTNTFIYLISLIWYFLIWSWVVGVDMQNIVQQEINKTGTKQAMYCYKSQNHSPLCQGQERQMESEDYHFTPTKSKMGDSDELGRIMGEKEGLIPVTDSPPRSVKIILTLH